MEKGQFSVEFIIVLGALFMALATITVPLYEQSKSDAQKTSDLTQAREAANKLANAANNVYFSGIGARKTVRYWLPEGVTEVRIDESIDKNGNGRLDVQIRFEQEDYENVTVDTLLPSKWDEKGNERDPGNRVSFDNRIETNADTRELHKTELTSIWNSEKKVSCRIVIEDQILREE